MNDTKLAASLLAEAENVTLRRRANVAVRVCVVLYRDGILSEAECCDLLGMHPEVLQALCEATSFREAA